MTIFAFFFIIILVILCLQWLERKRSSLGEGSILLPKGPVPGYVTVISSNHPHMKLLGHYQLQPSFTKDSWVPPPPPRYSSSPHLLSPLQDYTEKGKKSY
ncbi:hypothetical protein SK128_022190 [Halocaridina rubra]|uniref:Cytochrome P450 n=1 Tax=Halocaridina rubra TaxID=373956 RepID=A0AAN9AD34_HALRR